VPQAVAAAVGAGLDVTSPRPDGRRHRRRHDRDRDPRSAGVVRCLDARSAATRSTPRSRKLRNDERFSIGPLTAERLKIERGYAGRAPGPRVPRS
jgi:hypothetical protein